MIVYQKNDSQNQGSASEFVDLVNCPEAPEKCREAPDKFAPETLAYPSPNDYPNSKCDPDQCDAVLVVEKVTPKHVHMSMSWRLGWDLKKSHPRVDLPRCPIRFEGGDDGCQVQLEDQLVKIIKDHKHDKGE